MLQSKSLFVPTNYLLAGLLCLSLTHWAYYQNEETSTLYFYMFITGAFLIPACIHPAFRQMIRHTHITLTSSYQELDSSPGRIQRIPLVIAIAWSLSVFWLARDGLLSITLVALWIGNIIFWWWVLLRKPLRIPAEWLTWHINGHTIAVFGLLCLGAASMFFRLDSAPYEMLPDHRLILQDIIMIEDGTTPMYFTQGFGREPQHFYTSFMLSRLFGAHYITLQIASAILGLLTMGAIYFLGRQVGGRHLAIPALILCVSAVWIMISARSGFRAMTSAFPAALFLAFFWRALKDGNRHDFIAAGFFAGFGQYGYTAFRVTPLLIVFGLALGWYMRPQTERRAFALNCAVLVVIALVVFIPMLSYWVHFPDLYWMRSNDLAEGNTPVAFLNGLWESLLVFNTPNDPFTGNRVETWGAVGPVTGAFLIIGAALWLVTMILKRAWLMLLIPAALLVYLLPSALSNVTQFEIPSARRAIAAFPFVTVIGAYPLSLISRGFLKWRSGTLGIGAAALSLAIVLSLQTVINWHGFFNEYTSHNRSFTPPHREVAEVITNFLESGGLHRDVAVITSLDDIWLDIGVTTAWVDVTLPNFPLYTDLDGELCEEFLRRLRPTLFILPITPHDAQQWVFDCFGNVAMLTRQDDAGERIFSHTIVPIHIGRED